MEEYTDKLDSLMPFTQAIACEKATESPRYHAPPPKIGSYLCKRCGLALFRAKNEFSSHCGWPSFDESIPNTVKQLPDIDGSRTEILCNRCDSHLGHVFIGEQYTSKNTRYCVNLTMLDYVPSDKVNDTEEAIVAGGCFWGVEFYLQQLPGVLLTEVGYCGGDAPNPTYEQVCDGNTKHYEAVRVVFDIEKIDYSQVIKRFFEIHDFTQANGQGPDIGTQYQSAIFYFNDLQKIEAIGLKKQLEDNGYKVQTKLLPVQIFWPGESYHQDYYQKNKKTPYCHKLRKIFTI